MSHRNVCLYNLESISRSCQWNNIRLTNTSLNLNDSIIHLLFVSQDRLQYSSDRLLHKTTLHLLFKCKRLQYDLCLNYSKWRRLCQNINNVCVQLNSSFYHNTNQQPRTLPEILPKVSYTR